MLALLAQAAPNDFPSGPDDLERYLNAFYLLFGLGVLIGMLGGLFKSRTLQAIGDRAGVHGHRRCSSWPSHGSTEATRIIHPVHDEPRTDQTRA